jgi:CIC family chloride channel protein
MGLASALFIKAVYGFEDFFDGRIGGSLYRRQFLGMLCVGILIYLTFISLGNYSIQGVGYDTIETLLAGAKMSLLVLAALAGLKLIVTSLAFGSGASGGIFSPALFLGATLGAAYSTLLGQVVPFFSASAPEFALAGMAGAVGGSTGAVLAAITMLFEMTLDYHVIIPMTITVAISYGVRSLLSVESIYTLKNSRRGQTMPHGLHTNFHFQRRAGDIMLLDFSRFSAKQHADEAMQLATIGDVQNVLLIEVDGAIVGVLNQAQLAQALALGKHDASLSDLADPKFLRVDPATKLSELLATMRDETTWVALVRGPAEPNEVESVAGVITRKETTNAIVENIELMAD